MSRWFNSYDADLSADEARDMWIDEQHARRYRRQLAEHQHPNDPDNPDTDEGEDDEL